MFGDLPFSRDQIPSAIMVNRDSDELDLVRSTAIARSPTERNMTTGSNATSITVFSTWGFKSTP